MVIAFAVTMDASAQRCNSSGVYAYGVTVETNYDSAERMKEVKDVTAGTLLAGATYDPASGRVLTATRHNHDVDMSDVAVTETYGYAGLDGRLSTMDREASGTAAFAGETSA
jgi:hypothetical protein